MQSPAKPIVYVKHTCPFCFKVRLFLLDAGLLDQIDLLEAVSDADVEVFRRELGPHLAKISFPAAKFAGDDYVVGSDEILDRLATIFAVDRKNFPTFDAYNDGPFAQLIQLYSENAALRKSS